MKKMDWSLGHSKSSLVNQKHCKSIVKNVRIEYIVSVNKQIMNKKLPNASVAIIGSITTV